MNGLKARVMKKLGLRLREQKGQALPMALGMLALGSLVVVPLLNLTETTLRAGIREESRMYEHYAANAGIMDGIREIITDNPQLPGAGENWTYDISNTNNRNVNVVIYKIDQNNWKIATTAATGSGGGTEIECYVEMRTYSPNAITATSATIKNGAVIYGNVQYDSALGTLTNQGTINGEIIDRPIDWPAVAEVAAFYLEQVEGAPTYEGNLVLNLLPSTIGNPYSLGPIYINGNLTINSPSLGAFRLDGTVYVAGSVTIGNGVRMYQNNKNLYADGAGGINLQLGATAYGAGGIVARNNINYLCNTVPASYSIVWSLEGPVMCNPTGQFFGMLYSGELNTNGSVTAETGKVVNYVEPSADLFLPLLPGGVFRIVGWESGGI